MKPRFPTFRRLAGRFAAFASWGPRHTATVQRRALLRLIAVAAEERLPLVPLLAAWAEDERGGQKHRLQRLLKILESGVPLPDAVEQVPRVLGDEHILTVRFGCQSGTLAAAIRQALGEPELLSARAASDIRKALFYGGLMLTIGLPVVVFLQMKVFPPLLSIFADFSIESAWPLLQFQRFAVIAFQYWWVGALVLAVATWSVFSARPGRYIRDSILARYFRSLRAWRAADVMQKLSVAARAGRPLPGAISTLARYHFDPALRRKLLYVRNEVEQGEDLWHAMAAVKLLTEPEVAVLETAQRVGNRAWVLQQLARVKKHRSTHRLEGLSVLLLPLLVGLLATFVLGQALAVFATLTRLINALA